MKRIALAALLVFLAAPSVLAKITLTSGNIQTPAGLVVPNGSMELQLNTDATIIAAPGGQVMSSIPVLFNFDNTGNLAASSQIWSNAELFPQIAKASGRGTPYHSSMRMARKSTNRPLSGNSRKRLVQRCPLPQWSRRPQARLLPVQQLHKPADDRGRHALPAQRGCCEASDWGQHLLLDFKWH